MGGHRAMNDNGNQEGSGLYSAGRTQVNYERGYNETILIDGPLEEEVQAEV